jgi:hypothetical protein
LLGDLSQREGKEWDEWAELSAKQKAGLTIRSRRLAPAAIFNHILLAKLVYNVGGLAHPQAP